jgi:hypothetical protein
MRLVSPCRCCEHHPELDKRRRGIPLSSGEGLSADAQEYRCQETLRYKGLPLVNEVEERLWA